MAEEKSTPSSGANNANVAPAADQEVIFYVGSPKIRGEFGLLFKCIAAAAVMGALAVLPNIVGWISAPTLWPLPFALIAVVALFLPLLLVKKNKYRISNYRINHEQGLLNKRIDTVELWHVNDVRLDMSIIDRMLGVGTISVHSDDRTTPVLLLRSLPQPRKLWDQINQRVTAVKRQRGVLKLDSGHVHGDSTPMQ
jgi:membrane protein YdbS with pleckstrin-like domain